MSIYPAAGQFTRQLCSFMKFTVDILSIGLLYCCFTSTVSAGPKGGQKGHMPPRSDDKAYLAPQKKKLIIELMTPKASFYSNTYAITEYKNGRALVKLISMQFSRVP